MKSVTPCCVDLIPSTVHNGFVIRTDNDGRNQSFGHSDCFLWSFSFILRALQCAGLPRSLHLRMSA